MTAGGSTSSGTETAPHPRRDPGALVVFETQDARGGSMFVNPVGELVDLPRPTVGRGNPVTGPLEVRGAQTLTLVERVGAELRQTPLGHARFVPLVGEHGFDA